MQWHDVTRKIFGGPGKILGGQWPPGTPLAPPLDAEIIGVTFLTRAPVPN